MSYELLLLIVFIISVVFLSSGAITEYFTSSSKSLHNYADMCLTHKPFGFPSHDNMYRYWKDRPKSWAIEYSEDRIKGDINQVRSTQEVMSGQSQPAAVLTDAAGPIVDVKYYHNPVQYCDDSPEQYPCPNSWRARQTRPPSSAIPTGQTIISKPVSQLIQPVSDRDINDNYHMRIIEGGREDHGLCGNNTSDTDIFW